MVPKYDVARALLRAKSFARNLVIGRSSGTGSIITTKGFPGLAGIISSCTSAERAGKVGLCPQVRVESESGISVEKAGEVGLCPQVRTVSESDKSPSPSESE